MNDFENISIKWLVKKIKNKANKILNRLKKEKKKMYIYWDTKKLKQFICNNKIKKYNFINSDTDLPITLKLWTILKILH